MAAHARPDERHLADVIVVQHCAETDFVLQRRQLLHRARSALARAGERDVGLAVLDLGDVLQHHVDVDVGVGHGTEDLGGVARNVGQPDDGHLRLTAVVSHAGEDRVFHRDVLHRTFDERARLIGVRRAHVNGNVVTAGVFHATQHEHLGAARRHLEHFLEADGVQMPRVGHDARIGCKDAVDVRIDLANVGVQRRGERHGGGVRPAAAKRGDVLTVLADALKSGDEHDQTLREGVLQPSGRDVDDLRVAVRAGGDHAGLRTREGPGLSTQRVDGHGDQGVGDALPRGQEHVHLARRRARDSPGGPDPAGHRWCHPSQTPRRRRRCPPSWFRRCARRRGESGRHRPPRIHRTFVRRAPPVHLSGSIRQGSPTKDSWFAHAVFPSGAAVAWVTVTDRRAGAQRPGEQARQAGAERPRETARDGPTPGSPFTTPSRRAGAHVSSTRMPS